MMLMADCLAVLEVRDKAELKAEVVRFASRAGFRTVAASVVFDRAPGEYEFVTIDNVPHQYRELFEDAAKGRRDPVMQHCKRSSLPIAWNRSTYAGSGQLDLWEEQKSYGFVAGVALAMHLPEGRHFLVGLDRDQPLSTRPDLTTQTAADLRLFAAYAQDAAFRLLIPQSVEAGVLQLSARELECLRWTLDGKSAWEVGRIIGVAEPAVAQYLISAANKLECTDKNQAVAKAVRLKLIH